MLMRAASVRQVFFALRFRAEGVDRVHHKRGLHGKRAAIAAIDTLDLARDQAICDIGDAGAAIADFKLEQGEEALFAFGEPDPSRADLGAPLFCGGVRYQESGSALGHRHGNGMG